MSKFILSQEIPGIYWFAYHDKCDLVKAFARMQEYYESPNPRFNGKAFKLNEMLEWYESEYGTKYEDDWEGFNLPGRVIENFLFWSTVEPLSHDEMEVLEALRGVRGNFYVIGTCEGDFNTMRHEVAHALMHLYKEYSASVCSLLGNLDKYQQLVVYLKKAGYGDGVMVDEIHAYLMCDVNYLKEEKIWNDDWGSVSLLLNKNFDDFKNRLMANSGGGK